MSASTLDVIWFELWLYGPMTARKIAQRLDLSVGVVQGYLTTLRRQGRVRVRTARPSGRRGRPPLEYTVSKWE